MQMKSKRLAAIAVSLVLGFTGWISPALGEGDAQALNSLQLVEPDLVTEIDLCAARLQVLPLEDGTFLLGGESNDRKDGPLALAICVDADGVEQWRFTQLLEDKYANIFLELFALENDTLGLVLASIGEDQCQFLFLRDGEVLKRVEIAADTNNQFFQVNDRILCCSKEAFVYYDKMMTSNGASPTTFPSTFGRSSPWRTDTCCLARCRDSPRRKHSHTRDLWVRWIPPACCNGTWERKKRTFAIGMRSSWRTAPTLPWASVRTLGSTIACT